MKRCNNLKNLVRFLTYIKSLRVQKVLSWLRSIQLMLVLS